MTPQEMTEEQIEQAIAEMRDAERGTAYRLARVKATIHVTQWWLQLQGQDGPFEERKVLEGQVVASIILRNLYRKGVDFPLCSSFDGGISGTLNPQLAQSQEAGIPDGQSCATCPWNVFGSTADWEVVEEGKSKKGKACKERRGLVMLIPGIEGPVVVYLPTMSMGAWDAHAQALDMKGDSYIKHMTRFSLKVVTEGANTYGVAEVSDLGVLPKEQIAAALLDKKNRYVPLLSAQARVTALEPMEQASIPAGSDAGWDAMRGADDESEQFDQPF